MRHVQRNRERAERKRLARFNKSLEQEQQRMFPRLERMKADIRAGRDPEPLAQITRGMHLQRKHAKALLPR